MLVEFEEEEAAEENEETDGEQRGEVVFPDDEVDTEGEDN